MVARLSRSMSMSPRDVESKHTLDQIVLLWYLDVKDERQRQKLSAQDTAISVARLLAG